MSDDAAALEGHFLVTHADEDSAVLKDVDRGQVHTLADNEATLVRAARLGVERVEVRSDPGVVSVRYLP